MTSKKPVILSGGGVRYSDAGAAVLAFAEEFGIPVAETQAGKGEVSCESDWYLGCAGICGTLSANVITKQADLILAVGTKLNDFVTNSKNGFAADARFVSINTAWTRSSWMPNRLSPMRVQAWRRCTPLCRRAAGTPTGAMR